MTFLCPLDFSKIMWHGIWAMRINQSVMIKYQSTPQRISTLFLFRQSSAALKGNKRFGDFLHICLHYNFPSNLQQKTKLRNNLVSGFFQVFCSRSSREDIVKKNSLVRNKVDWSKDLERSYNISHYMDFKKLPYLNSHSCVHF